MSSHTPPPPPPPGSSGPPPPPGEHGDAAGGKQPFFRRTWVGWVGGGLIGLFIGVAGAGGADDPDAELAGTEPQPAETVTVTAEPEPAETVTDTAEPEPAETVTVTGEPEPAETVTVTAKPEPADDGGDYTAGRWSFSDVQISKDFVDDFEVRARVTNTGDAVGGVVWTVSLFQGGSVVGTAQATASNVAPGATVTATFVSTDDYVDGVDEVEFQVDTEF